jgi:hypothetical protein
VFFTNNEANEKYQQGKKGENVCLPNTQRQGCKRPGSFTAPVPCAVKNRSTAEPGAARPGAQKRKTFDVQLNGGIIFFLAFSSYLCSAGIKIDCLRPKPLFLHT